MLLHLHQKKERITMKISRTSTYYFKYSCQEVYDTVTTNYRQKNITYMPINTNHPRDIVSKTGQIIARVTNMSPAVSCAFELYAPKFDVSWLASFSDVKNECQMIMTETYIFHKDAKIQYLLALLFLKQKRQHKAYFYTINNQLRLQEFKQISKNTLKDL